MPEDSLDLPVDLHRQDSL